VNRSRHVLPILTAVTVGAGLLVAPGALGAPGHRAVRAPAAAPGGPGRTAVFSPADKSGFATSYGRKSKVWFTLRSGTLSDIYYPNLSTPSARSLQLVVTDGSTFTDVESTATRHAVRLLDHRSLTYQQVDTAKSGDYRITKTYVSDPKRATVLMHIRLTSLTGKPYRAYVDYLPYLHNIGSHDTAATHGSTLVATAGHAASALISRPALGASTNGYLGRSGGLAELRAHHRLTHHYGVARDGDVEQTALTGLTGTPGHRSMTLALGFGTTTAQARRTASASLGHSFTSVMTAYQAGWHGFLQSLKRPPADVASIPKQQTLYDVSVMVLAAGEDKTHRGAFIASPSMPWAWGRPATNKPKRSGPYHLVWSRDLYQIATALLVAGDRPAVRRAEHFLFRTQQLPDGGFPQNSTTKGTPYWTGHQLDEWSFPTILAWQLHDTSASTWTHVKRAEDLVIATGPNSDQERWENQSGYSPATIAAEISGLVCAADLATANHHPSVAAHYLAVADDWAAHVKAWTATTNGPLSTSPYFLRVAKDGKPNAATTYSIGDSGPAAIDQRKVVDPSFLELTRLGVLSPTDPDVTNTLRIVDRTLKVKTPGGPMWHRYTDDGYGETAAGKPWVIQATGTPKTFGRLWPLLSGERGEYAIETGKSAAPYLRAIASAAGKGFLLPEQVWDGRAPTGHGGRRIGSPTLSASPLLWTHAQFVRLAWDARAGRILEQPKVVAQRYTAHPAG
jgi:glucoamylase